MTQKKAITASEMGKRGAKGRMKKLSPEQRKEIAQRAAQARWAKQKQKRDVQVR